ncbi:MAG: SoxR reducing system RseC family protein [Rhodocyclaceae bacterium]
MSKVKVVVMAVDGVNIRFKAEAASGCGGCASRGLCGVGGEHHMHVGAEVASRARAGEEMELEVADSAVLVAAAAAYVPPLAGFMMGGGTALAAGRGEGALAVAAMAGLLAGFVISRWLARRVAARLAPALHSACGVTRL